SAAPSGVAGPMLGPMLGWTSGSPVMLAASDASAAATFGGANARRGRVGADPSVGGGGASGPGVGNRGLAVGSTVVVLGGLASSDAVAPVLPGAVALPGAALPPSSSSTSQPSAAGHAAALSSALAAGTRGTLDDAPSVGARNPLLLDDASMRGGGGTRGRMGSERDPGASVGSSVGPPSSAIAASTLRQRPVAASSPSRAGVSGGRSPPSAAVSA